MKGNQVWNIQAYGNPRPSAVMSGHASGASHENEDWLISKSIAIDAAFAKANLSFETNARFQGNELEAYIVVDSNYTGDPTTTQWIKLDSAQFDTDLTAFQPVWAHSGQVSLNSYIGKTIRVAFKYTSTTAGASTWQVDNVVISATK